MLAGAGLLLLGVALVRAAAAPTPKRAATTSPSPGARARRANAVRPGAHASATAGLGRPPIEIAKDARTLEEIGAYARAAQSLRMLRAQVAPDADLELELALDEARSGDLDSAAARLSAPLLDLGLVDSMPVTRRHDYEWIKEALWINGKFDGWYWYIARARAEVAAARGRWEEARVAAQAAVAARYLSGKEWLIYAVCAGRAGDALAARAAADHAATLDPSLPEAQYLAGLWAWKQGRRGEAQDGFRAAVALDSSYREPAVALIKSRLPGVAPDTLPSSLLTGIRRVGLLTSPLGPKLEEFVQMDEPATILTRVSIGIPDSLSEKLDPVELMLPIFVDENGRADLHELPWFEPRRLPEPIVSALLGTLPKWRFSPAKLHGEPHRVWAAVQYALERPKKP